MSVCQHDPASRDEPPALARAIRRLAAILALALLGFSPGGLLAQEGGIAGAVTDDASGAPLASVYVEIVGADGTVVASGVTGPGGAYRIGGVPAGTYTVRFTSAGWGTVTETGQTVVAGDLSTLSVTMSEQSYRLNPITVTASKTEEKALDAPAAVEVVSTEDIAERPATTIAEHVKGEPGVDVINTGVQGSYVVVRGFNNIFSGATLTMTDNRIARVPSLRANISHFNPTSSLDLDRVEVVLGPGSALYGPNAANGVIHSITRSPIGEPGASLSVGGGLRQQSAGTGFESNDEGLYHMEGRVAVSPSDRFGAKVSGQYFSATEYLFTDPEEAEQQTIAQACIAADYALSNEACLNFAQGLDLTDPVDQAILRQSVDNVAGGRNNDLERWAVDGRVDFHPTPETSVILAAGHSRSVSSVDLTGLGAGQVVDWGYNYLQGRFNYREFFAQAFWNRSANDETYLLRSGRPLVDKSQLFVGQLQNATRIGERYRLIYGADLLRTVPRTEGTINGQNEEDDDITEVGGYAQLEWSIDPRLDVVGAVRLDNHSRLDNPVFSPRAALVYKPDLANTFRATFNRAFSTPTTLNMFLDISGGTVPLFGPFQYDVRATGSTTMGHTFMRDANGVPMHMSPFAPLIGQSKRTFLPTTAPQLFAEAAAAVSAANPQAAQLLGLIGIPAEGSIPIVALTLDPSLSEDAAPTAECPAPPFCLTPGGLAGIQDIDRLDPTITNTFEIGYKGLLGERVLLGVNAWWSHITDFVSALQVSTPNVFLDGAATFQFLDQQFQPLVGTVFPDAATATATAQAIALGTPTSPGMAQIPLGVVTTTSVGGTEPSLALVYRNLGSLDVFGGEIGAQIVVSDLFEISGSLSIVDKNEFTTEGDNPEVVPLNAPTVKGTAKLTYRDDDSGLNGSLRFRAQNGFAANSGVYIGEVDGFETVDLGLGWRIPGYRDLWLQVDVQNVFDSSYQTFVGTPQLGRLILARVRWDYDPF